MPLPPTFIPIYTRQPQVDPIYRRYGLDDLSSGISAQAAGEYALRFAGGQALGHAGQLMEARGQTPTNPLEGMPSPFAPGPTTAELLQQQQAAELMGEAPAVAPSAPVYPDVTMRPPKALSPLLQPEELNKRYGVEGRLKFDKPEYQEAAELLHEWAIDDVTREETLRRADQSLGAQAIRLGAGLVGSMLDPLNVASAFVPVIPEAMFASAMAKAGGMGARAALRFGKGAVEGGVGAGLLEPIVYMQSKAEQADYTLWDSLANVAFGTVLGGGLHAGGGAVADAVGRMRWSERAEILKGAVGQFVDRGEVRVDGALPLEARMAWRDALRQVEEATGAAPGRAAASAGEVPAGAAEDLFTSATRRAAEPPFRFEPFVADQVPAGEGPKGLLAAGEPEPWRVGAFDREGQAGKTTDYTLKPGDRRALMGTLDQAENGRSGQWMLYHARPDSKGRSESFPLPPRTTRPEIAKVGAKMLAGEPLSRREATVAEALMTHAREWRAEAATGALESRRARMQEQAAHVDAIASREAAFWTRDALAPSSDEVADLREAGVMADLIAKAPKVGVPEASIVAIQKDMAVLDEQLQAIGPEVPERTTAGGEEAAPQFAAWLDADDRAYLAEADEMIAQAAAKADVARVAALCGLGVG